MTPNITDITLPARSALESGCEGVAAINTIQSVMGVNLKTLRPEPSVEGYTTPGGYSSVAVKPIALAKVSHHTQNPTDNPGDQSSLVVKPVALAKVSHHAKASHTVGSVTGIGLRDGRRQTLVKACSKLCC